MVFRDTILTVLLHAEQYYIIDFASIKEVRKGKHIKCNTKNNFGKVEWQSLVGYDCYNITTKSHAATTYAAPLDDTHDYMTNTTGTDRTLKKKC